MTDEYDIEAYLEEQVNKPTSVESTVSGPALVDTESTKLRYEDLRMIVNLILKYLVFKYI